MGRQKDKISAHTITFRLPEPDFRWLSGIVAELDSRPDQVGRVTVSSVVVDIIKKARESNYGKVQAAPHRS